MKDDFLNDEWVEEVLSGGDRTLSFKTSVKKSAANEAFRKVTDQLMNNPHVTIGFHAGDGSEPNGLTVAEVAFFNEFGTARIPERSFMRSTVDERREDYNALIEKLIALMYKGDTDVLGALAILGQRVESDIKDKITRLRFPPNAPSTIKQKGSDNPLIDTGNMRASVRYVVHDGRGK